NAGCRIERRTYYELDRADPLLRSLISRRAFDESDEEMGTHFAAAPTTSCVVIVPVNSDIALRPHDVGIGVSQIVPVIVSALDGEERLVAIEQPELHIHPRLQAEVADLFIEAIQKNKHRFIIETHSEHLILRLLRRIRETENGKVPTNRHLRTDDLSIYYLKQENGSTRQLRIDVDVKGEFIQPWPDDFFEIDFYERFT
ncbi:MAG: AAA family ATPase, partial [Pirellulaceae bacterium]